MSTTITAAPLQDLDGGPLKLTAADEAVRGDLLAAVAQLHDAGVLPLTGSSNGSVRLASNPEHILLSARGLRADLDDEDFGVVDLDGALVGGWLDLHVQPVIGMHTAIYRHRPQAGAVLHTHSLSATAFALAHRPIPLHYEPLLYRGQLQEIPVTAYGRRDRGDLIGRVADTIEAHPATKAMLLANHGLLAWDASAQATATLIVTIEEAAAITLKAAALGGSQAIPPS
jgi:ribulose-5-phosphate 4-epimerase/fuculose-1-phosphate aldolase